MISQASQNRICIQGHRAIFAGMILVYLIFGANYGYMKKVADHERMVELSEMSIEQLGEIKVRIRRA